MILLVDDSKPMLKLLEMILKRRFSVHPVLSAFEAINWLQKGNTPDVIVTDIEIPHIDGVDFITHVSNSVYYNHIPILVLSGYSEEEVRKNNKSLKIEGYITKPFDPVQLLGKISEIIIKNSSATRLN